MTTGLHSTRPNINNALSLIVCMHAQIEGLTEALELPNSGVVSNYSSDTVTKTWEALQAFNGGHAVFSFPPLPIKCPGAPQKIMYYADDYFRKVASYSSIKGELLD